MGTGGMRLGAGRPGWRVKAEHCLRLDVRDLGKRRLLLGGSYGWRWTNKATGEVCGSIGLRITGSSVELSFSAQGRPVTQHVPLDRTSCHYGGARPWFRCPRCSRRVAVLFHRGGLFRCRTCSGVAYCSQAEDAVGRAWRRQSKLEARLAEGWAKPKGMHRATRDRIIDRIWECEEERDAALMGLLARMEARMARLGGTLGL